MNISYSKFYLISLGCVILASVYPIYMGIAALISFLNNGYIEAVNYKKYIIPYTPICIALIISVALLPVAFKVFKRYTLPVISIFSIAIFFVAEIGFERIKVIEGFTDLTVDSWQLGLCVATPEVLRSVGLPIYAENNPAYKVHFYIIAVVIIIAVTNVIYGFSKMIIENNYYKKRPLTAQVVSAAIFIGLCIFACMTAFYRNGTLQISATSAILMSVFFIVFGVTVGAYVGCIFYGKNSLLSVVLPVISSIITTIVMYIGELILMGGVLYKFGSGPLFEPIAGLPFAATDYFVILLSGVVTYAVMRFINKPSRTVKV